MAHDATRSAWDGGADPAGARRADHARVAGIVASDDHHAAADPAQSGRETLAHPVVGWALFGGTLVAYYLSPLFEASLQRSWLHAVVHLHFLLIGCLFLWALVGIDVMPRPLPHGVRLLAVLVAIPFHAFLGVALLSTTTPLAPSVYPSLGDQHAAAGILWASGELLTLAIAAIVFAQWWAAEQRESVRVDRRLSASHP